MTASFSPAMFEWTATTVALALLLLCAWHNRRTGYKAARDRSGAPIGFELWLARLGESVPADKDSTDGAER